MKKIRRKVIRQDGTLDIDASMKAFEDQPDAGPLEDIVRAAEDGEIVTFEIPDDSPLAKYLEGIRPDEERDCWSRRA